MEELEWRLGAISGTLLLTIRTDDLPPCKYAPGIRNFFSVSRSGRCLECGHARKKHCPPASNMNTEDIQAGRQAAFPRRDGHPAARSVERQLVDGKSLLRDRWDRRDSGEWNTTDRHV